MVPTLSQEMRRNIVIWRFQLQKTGREIAALANCSEATVWEVLRLHREYGQVTSPNAQRRGRARILETADVQFLSSLLLANPTLYLDELQEQLSKTRNVDVSIATLSRSLTRIALSHKSISKTAAERNELLRATWQAEYGEIPAEYFVWIDESSVDDKTNQRLQGWAGLGRACVRRATFIRGQRYSVLPALCYEGIVALDIFEGSVTKERFMNFLKNDLVCMPFNLLPLIYSLKTQAPQLNPYPGVRSVVVMDNCAIHHDEEVRAIVEGECGVYSFSRVCCNY